MVKNLSKAQVTLPSEHEVTVTRQFAAPRTLVFEAYTTPSLVRRWLLGPPGWTMPLCEMDVRVGGKFRWRWRNDRTGKEFGFYGEYREVSPPRWIVSTQFFDPGDVGGDMGDGAVVTVELTEENGVTTLVTSMNYGSRQARDAAVSTGMSEGMEQSYLRLDQVLTEHRSTTI